MVSNPVGNFTVRVSIAFSVIDTVAVALRLLSRTRTKASLAADDALITASLVPLYGMVVIGHFGVAVGGMGLTTALNVELGHGTSRVSTLLKLMMSAMVTYTLTITIVKLSILVLYRRIFCTTIFKRVTLIVGAVVMFWFIVAIFADIFQCRPFHAAFNPELLPTKQCINMKAYYRGVTASNLCIDVVMLYMPLHMVWKLRLPVRRKVALSGIFLLGTVVCLAAAMRIFTLGYMQYEDLTLTLAYTYAWSQIEPALAILCACLVTLRPLFVNLNLKSRVAKLSNRFSRNKNMPFSSAMDSRGEHGSQAQQPAVQGPRQENERFGDTEHLHTVNIELETRDMESQNMQSSTSV